MITQQHVAAFLDAIRLGCYIEEAGEGEYIIDGVINVRDALDAAISAGRKMETLRRIAKSNSWEVSGDDLREWAQAAISAAQAQPVASVSVTVDEAWQELVEMDDRTSPAEYPDHALITREELADFMSRR